MKRYKYLDVARGIAMMLIITGHSCGLSKYLSYFFIQVFFLLSGCLYRPGRSYGENIRKKAKRLLLPYFGYSAILLAFYVLMGRSLRETAFSAVGILYSRYCLYDVAMTAEADNIFFFNIANGAMWYLTAFFVTGLIFHLVIDRCLESRKFLVVCIAALTAITMAFTKLPVLLPWSLDIAFVGAIFMIVGALLMRADFFEKKWNIWLILATLAAYVGLVELNPGINTSAREYGVYGMFSVLLYILIGIGGSLLCIWLAKLIQDTFFGTFFTFIGTNTLVLLAFHILGLEIFGIAANRLIDTGALSGVGKALYHTVRISVSIAGSLILGKMLDFVMGKLRSLIKANAEK